MSTLCPSSDYCAKTVPKGTTFPLVLNGLGPDVVSVNPVIDPKQIEYNNAAIPIANTQWTTTMNQFSGTGDFQTLLMLGESGILSTQKYPITVTVNLKIQSPVVSKLFMIPVLPGRSAQQSDPSDLLLFVTDEKNPFIGTIQFTTPLTSFQDSVAGTQFYTALVYNDPPNTSVLPVFAFSILEATFTTLQDTFEVCYSASKQAGKLPNATIVPQGSLLPQSCSSPPPKPLPPGPTPPGPRPDNLGAGAIAGITIASAAVATGIVLAAIYGSRALKK